jgi:hypothetical protein
VSLRRLQLVLASMVVAAAIVMAGLLSSGARVGCLVLVVAATWLTEPERSRSGGGWWLLVAAGAALAVLGFAIAEASEPAETEAGIIAIAGSALVIVGATIGFPTRR